MHPLALSLRPGLRQDVYGPPQENPHDLAPIRVLEDTRLPRFVSTRRVQLLMSSLKYGIILD